MPANRNALLRYKTIDQCLQNRYRKWTLNDLIDACSDALHEYEGIDKGLSKRTVQADIQMMRSDKLGYNAPIIVVDRKYYTYEDPEYSITNIPLSEHDLDQLGEAVEFMKQFQGFSHFQSLEGMVQKLEDHITSSKQQTTPIIDFEKNENLRGIGYLNPIYQAILKKTKLIMTYKSFKAREASSFEFKSYILKEYRNRWFVIGERSGNSAVLNLALDRIISLRSTEEVYEIPEEFNAREYFNDVVGVSVSKGLRAKKVVLKFTHQHAPYVETKPIHHSQKKLERDYFGVSFSYEIQSNFEFEREILGFGDGVKVISPEKLRNNIRNRLLNAQEAYSSEFYPLHLKQYRKTLRKRGFLTTDHVLTRRECKPIYKAFFRKENEDRKIDPKKKQEILFELCKHPNLIHLFQLAQDEYFVYSIEVIQNINQPIPWNQHIPEALDVITKKKNRILLKGTYLIDLYFGDTSPYSTREVISRSHTKQHKPKDLKLIVENTNPQIVTASVGGAICTNNALIQQSDNQKSQKPIKAIRFQIIPNTLKKVLGVEETSILLARD